MGNGKSFLFMADKKKKLDKAGNTVDTAQADHILSFLIIFFVSMGPKCMFSYANSGLRKFCLPADCFKVGNAFI